MKLDRQCTYEVTSKRILVTIVAWRAISILSVCVCSLIYPACNAHEPYYIAIFGLSDSATFSHIVS